MSVAFGKRCPRYESTHLDAFFEMLDEWFSIAEPGAQPPVDFIPILRFVPERWAPWKALCRRVRSIQREFYFGLLAECEDRLAKGEENGCYMEDLLRRQDEYGLNRETSAYVSSFLTS